MNPHKALFEKYSRGELASNKLDELHQMLIDIYFHSPGELNPDEFEYSEDLIIEKFVDGKLEEKYIKPFQDAIARNSELSKKTNLLSELSIAIEETKSDRVSKLIASESLEEEREEEEQLSKIVQEAIEKVHAEKESSPGLSFNAWSKIKDIINELFAPVLLARPQLRMAVVFASIIVIGIVAWVLIRPSDKEMITGNTSLDSAKNITQKKTDTTQIKDTVGKQVIPPQIHKLQYASIDSIKKRRIMNDHVAHQSKKPIDLIVEEPITISFDLAYADLTPTFETNQTRSGSSSEANDTYIEASMKYDSSRYQECIFLLESLISKKYFSDKDTINEINFFLGNCYFALAFGHSDNKLLHSSLRSYDKIEKNSYYYNDSRWYSALALIKLGKNEEGLHLLSSLPLEDDLRSIKILKLRESLNK